MSMTGEQSRSDAFELIKEAIAEKKSISAVYHDKRRELCPHALGWKADREHALFFQVGGESAKGLTITGSWRCLNLDEFSEVEIIEGEFRTGPRYYDNPQHCVKIETQIPPLRVVSRRAII